MTSTEQSPTPIELHEKYAPTYRASDQIDFVGIGDGFVSIDRIGRAYANGVRPSGEPEVTIVGVTIAAHALPALPRVELGDVLSIEGELYRFELVPSRERFRQNGDLALVPVEAPL